MRLFFQKSIYLSIARTPQGGMSPTALSALFPTATTSEGLTATEVASQTNCERSSDTPTSMDILERYITGNLSENGDTLVSVWQRSVRPTPMGRSARGHSKSYMIACMASDIAWANLSGVPRLARAPTIPPLQFASLSEAAPAPPEHT